MESFLDCLNISVTSYGFMLNFFPIYSSMKERNNKNAISSVFLAITFVFLSYGIFAFVAYLSFGLEVSPNIFDNLKQDDGIFSIAIRILFLVIFICNLPFTFLAGKECCLIFIMEYREKIITKQI